MGALRGEVSARLIEAVNNERATSTALQPLPAVKGIFGWGCPLSGPLLELQGSTDMPPLLFANGALDANNASAADGYFDRAPAQVLRPHPIPDKAAATLADLRHFSIADRQWLVRDEPESTMPQREQAQRVIALASVWFANIDEALSVDSASASLRLQHALQNAATVLPLVQRYWA
jgi:hypothetical protein